MDETPPDNPDSDYVPLLERRRRAMSDAAENVAAAAHSIADQVDAHRDFLAKVNRIGAHTERFAEVARLADDAASRFTIPDLHDRFHVPDTTDLIADELLDVPDRAADAIQCLIDEQAANEAARTERELQLLDLMQKLVVAQQALVDEQRRQAEADAEDQTWQREDSDRHFGIQKWVLGLAVVALVVSVASIVATVMTAG